MFVEVPVEQQGVSGAVAQSARTVLPGEPFDPPAASQVPGPRDMPQPGQPHLQGPPPAPQIPPMQQMPQPPHMQPMDGQLPPAAPNLQQQPMGQPFQAPAFGEQPPSAEYAPPAPAAAQWTYGPAGAPSEMPGPSGFDGYEMLHEYAALPPAPPFEQPAAATQQVAGPQTAPQPPMVNPLAAPPAPTPDAFGAPAGYPAMPGMPPSQSYNPYTAAAFGQQLPDTVMPGSVPGGPAVDMPGGMPPLTPLPLEDDTASGGHRRGDRKPNKALLGLLVVAILGGGGYYGYTHFIKKSDSSSQSSSTPSTTTPTKPATPVTPGGSATKAKVYAFPAALNTFQLQSGAKVTAAKAPVQKFVNQVFTPYAKTLTYASYELGSPQVYGWTIRPGAANVPAAYKLLLNRVQAFRQPGAVFLPMTVQPAGAAGGQMTCGGQRGTGAASYCVWRGSDVVGYFTITGANQAWQTAALTRELRAYAEH